MKNLMKSAFVAMSMGVFMIPASAETLMANPVCAQDTVVKKDTTIKENPEKTMLLAQEEVTYTKVEVSALPEAVTKAAAAKYEGYAIDEAYKGSDNNYKLVIKKEDAKLIVFFNEAGEFLKEGEAKAEGTVLV